jgi:hypothetical protein
MATELARDMILAEPAGARLDAWIAERVFGGEPDKEFVCPKCGGDCWHRTIGKDKATGEPAVTDEVVCDGCQVHSASYSTSSGGCGWRGTWEDIANPPYSTDIGAAWEVVEKMHRMDECLSLNWRRGDITDDKMRWAAEFRQSEEFAVSDSAPLAICRAALLAVVGG